MIWWWQHPWRGVQTQRGIQGCPNCFPKQLVHRMEQTWSQLCGKVQTVSSLHSCALLTALPGCPTHTRVSLERLSTSATAPDPAHAPELGQIHQKHNYGPLELTLTATLGADDGWEHWALLGFSWWWPVWGCLGEAAPTASLQLYWSKQHWGSGWPRSCLFWWITNISHAAWCQPTVLHLDENCKGVTAVVKKEAVKINIKVKIGPNLPSAYSIQSLIVLVLSKFSHPLNSCFLIILFKIALFSPHVASHLVISSLHL